MDAIEILGSLLGHKSSRPGKGTDVLKDILGGATRKSTPPPRKSSPPPKRVNIDQQAKELEDLLNVANQRKAPGRRTPERSQPRSSSRSVPNHLPSRHAPAEPVPTSATPDNDRALILVRAMVNAAKSDGQIDPTEQQNILDRLNNPSSDAVRFLRDEFQKPLNVPEFARSVPIGMEQQVYTMSLIAIDLDTGREAKYLMELAENLRLPAETREQIHERLGAPSIY